MKDLIWCSSVGVRRRSWHLGYSNRSSPILSSQEIKSPKAVTQFLFILPLLTLLGSPNPLLIGTFRNSDFELSCRNWFVKDLELQVCEIREHACDYREIRDFGERDLAD